MASDATRGKVVDMLKDAFVQADQDEFDARVAYAFTSPTCADLAALTAGVHGLPRLD